MLEFNDKIINIREIKSVYRVRARRNNTDYGGLELSYLCGYHKEIELFDTVEEREARYNYIKGKLCS